MDYSRLFSLFLCLTIVQSQDSDKPTGDLVCPAVWLSHKDQCYLIQGGNLGFDVALETCMGHDATLAELNDRDTMEFLYHQVHAACEDRDRKCPEFADNGQCWKPGFHDWMRENCRFSCGLCISLCRNDPDYHQMCVSTVETSGCPGIEQTERFYCDQTCGCGGFSRDFWLNTLENPKNPGTNSEWVAELETHVLCDPDGHEFHVLLDSTLPLDASIGCAPSPDTFTAAFICQKAPGTADPHKVVPHYTGCPLKSVGYENKCYIYNGASTSWSESNKECQNFNGVLASLPNRELAEKLMAEMPWLDHLVWLGLSLEGDGPYRWLNQRRVQYLPWGERTGEEKENCVLMDLLDEEPYLELEVCDFNHSSVCEIPRHGYPQESPQEDTRLEVDLAECHRPWVAHGEFCYQVFTVKKTWADAEKSCQDVQGSLVSLHGRADLGWINTLMLTFGDAESLDSWIGLTQVSGKTAYAWTDGSPVDFMTDGIDDGWQDGEAEKCIKVLSTNWTRVECNKQLPYVCQIPREIYVRATTEAPMVSTTAAAKTPPAVDDGIESREDVDKQPEVIKSEPAPADDQDPADVRGDQDPADVKGDEQGSEDCDSPKRDLYVSNWQLMAIVIAAVAFIAILSFVIVAVSGLRRRSDSTSASTVRATKSVTYANTVYNPWDTPPLPPPPPRDAEAAGGVEVEDDASISPYDIPGSGRSSLASSTRRLVHERDEDIIPVVGFENAVYGVASSRRRDH